ncbi:Conserved_hypothetical protein [Hexamita inflata]|uniref:Uncharacterized protein n=1 Tax=Hexamita inflata TaxID=28002 RepID=A0AA86U1Q3_9EUKA|nr:Conserved hypothetical protein [Hexamita inflata]
MDLVFKFLARFQVNKVQTGSVSALTQTQLYNPVLVYAHLIHTLLESPVFVIQVGRLCKTDNVCAQLLEHLLTIIFVHAEQIASIFHNISNTCSCPSGAILINGVCSCTKINAYISGNQCVCPTYSLLVGNTCTCPNNSQIVNNICICNFITGQIMNNGTCECYTIGAFVNNNVCTCGLNALNISNICTCPTNSSLVNNICTCDQIAGQLIIAGACQCPTGQSVVNETCKQINYVINISDFECSQELFTQQFDIQSITYQITDSNNFSAGYVFSSTTVIQNAFIDISNQVYSTTVSPLFQSQSTFINLKIQFGTQTLNSGSLLQTSSSISINQMNIISRSSSQLTVNSAKQLNILTSLSIGANITNLLVNLSYAPSSGNITLINTINGVFNISGYQILGTFISTGTVAMIGLNIYYATVIVNQVTIKPTAFSVGNSSSYLLGNATTTSTIYINNFAVILGSSSNYLLLNSISSISPNTYYYQFGGIIAYINCNSILSVNNIILDSYQKFSTGGYVSWSGFLVGYNGKSSLSSITIKNMCLQQNMISTTTFYYFGLIGWNIGNTSVINVTVTFSVEGAYFNCFGIIGYQYSGSINADVVNLRTSVNISSGSGQSVGSLFGAVRARNCSVQNASMTRGNISSGSTDDVGGFIGQQDYNVTIINSSIQQTNISGSSEVGGFIGYQYQSTLYIINSQIHLVRLLCSYNIGIVAGYISGNIYFVSSSSTQIYINGVLRSNCQVLSNGC